MPELIPTQPHTASTRHDRGTLFRAWQAICLRAPDAATAAEDAAALGLLVPLAPLVDRQVPARLLGAAERKTACGGTS